MYNIYCMFTMNHRTNTDRPRTGLFQENEIYACTYKYYTGKNKAG